MKNKFYSFIIFLFLALLIHDCASGVKSRNLLFRSNEFAIYTVNRDNLKVKSESSIPEKLEHPLQITDEKVLDLLGNIRYRE
jgi:hypothetical protein